MNDDPHRRRYDTPEYREYRRQSRLANKERMNAQIRDEITHKRKPPSINGRGPRSICGRSGYVVAMWRSVNCDVCLSRKPKERKR